jgi:uncharacterized protein YndB with AHSA1/START domain
MTGPDGTESWGKAIYSELVKPERIVYIDKFSDAEGNDAADMPEMVITLEFIDEGGKTRIRSTSEFAKAEALQAVVDMGVVQGLSETWDRLEEYLTAGAQ